MKKSIERVAQEWQISEKRVVKIYFSKGRDQLHFLPKEGQKLGWAVLVVEANTTKIQTN